MRTSAAFRFPMTSPTKIEAEALARAAAYLRRSANELETRKLGYGYGLEAPSPLDDFPSALSAAGNLCTALLDNASIH